MTDGGRERVRADDEVVPAIEAWRLEDRVRELERQLGRKALEVRTLKESNGKKATARKQRQESNGA